MALFTSNNSRSKVNILLLLFATFIVYCIYIISYNLPTTTTARHESSTSIPTRNPKSDICKTDQVLRNVDPNHTNAHIEFWRHLNEATIQVYKKRWQKFVSSVEHTHMPRGVSGRGIVLVAGNGDTFDRALTTIKLLRHLQRCKLNIEVWHLSDEQPSQAMRQELEDLGATPRDLSDPQLVRPIIHRRNADKQFQIKAAAVINSAFKEVLYLDSDNVPAQDPTFLFDTPEYKSMGALFWPDFWKTHGDNKIFNVLDIPCEDEWEQESGQMVIDKEKSWVPLQLAWYMQKHYEIYFQFLNGDKDTFKYAWKALNKPYHMAEAFLGMAGTMVNNRFCGHTMLQYTPTSDQDDDRILFVHANLLKITDKNHFIHGDQPEHPWDLAKRSTMNHANTWIKPEFYISNQGQACMDFTHRQGEPDAITEDFDYVLPDFQANYFKFGGIGGETR
ncbi:mannosyltransferase putative-domain-containing protein [Parasitella parasitica]|nr:mannosyltransferase putative-domain-containing protein [Parasitella parasitica]